MPRVTVRFGLVSYQIAVTMNTSSMILGFPNSCRIGTLMKNSLKSISNVSGWAATKQRRSSLYLQRMTAMRKARRAQHQEPHETASGGARLPKPDFVRTALNAAELHAYYIALI